MIYVTDIHGLVKPHAHLFSDKSAEELVIFAAEILGLEPDKAHWVNPERTTKIVEFHFNISEADRNTCIFRGAKAINKKELVKHDYSCTKVTTI
ncbi:MAG TPA: DUF4031 domain-containing protein [Candidatus Nanoarchaeia archaeon]|nr:DUF4031 domain-containing protein [Candidatus Nanoarchaeia archaeon]